MRFHPKFIKQVSRTPGQLYSDSAQIKLPVSLTVFLSSMLKKKVLKVDYPSCQSRLNKINFETFSLVKLVPNHPLQQVSEQYVLECSLFGALALKVYLNIFYYMATSSRYKLPCIQSSHFFSQSRHSSIVIFIIC